MKILILMTLSLLTLPHLLQAKTFKVDTAHSNVNFEVAHLVISTVTGRFDTYDGTFSLDDKGNLQSLTGSVAAGSINTNNKKRDEHLRSEDFFAADKNAKLSLKLDNLNIAKGTSSKAKGSLTIRGITKPVTFDIKFLGTTEDLVGDTKGALKAEASINRKEFGLKWNQALETGGVLVGDEVTIKLHIQGDRVQESEKKQTTTKK